MQIVDNYRQLALDDTPMIDVRAPVEFVKGAILSAINLPLMDDAERHKVGICYKEQGQQAAIELGHQLVSGLTRDNRVAAWCDYFDANPNTHIYCFRGGLRSKTSQRWIVESGRDIPLIKGGYKAFRQYLLQQTESLVGQWPLHIIGGKTGCGKTEVLAAMNNILDLEGLANHRGSSFGKKVTPQPSQINFENQLAKRLLQLQQNGVGALILEDESRIIGRCALPLVLKEKMLRSPVYMLEDDFESRVARILDDYVIQMDQQFTASYGEEDGQTKLEDYLTKALNGIRRRLGPQRHTQLQEVLQDALRHHQSSNDYSRHEDWIRVLLNEYYDPLYDYQISKKQDRIVYRGTAEELLSLMKEKQNQWTNSN